MLFVFSAQIRWVSCKFHVMILFLPHLRATDNVVTAILEHNRNRFQMKATHSDNRAEIIHKRYHAQYDPDYRSPQQNTCSIANRGKVLCAHSPRTFDNSLDP